MSLLDEDFLFAYDVYAFREAVGSVGACNVAADEHAVGCVDINGGVAVFYHFNVCYVVYYAVNKLRRRLGLVSFVCLLGVCLFAVSRLLHIVSFDNAMYFLAGVAVRQSGVGFMSAFRPSWLSVFPLALFCVFSPGGMDRSTLQGVVMTYLAMSLTLASYPYLPSVVRRIAVFVGGNTLSILLFSPLFTIITKRFVPLFSFDPTALLFTVVSVVFVIAGSLGVAWTMDKLRLSRMFCGKDRLLSPIQP